MIQKGLHVLYSILMFVGIILSQTGIAKNNKVSFMGQTVVDHKDIYLADIIEPKSFGDLSGEAQKYLKEIRLGDSPLAGESRRFTNYAISEIIRHHVKSNSLFRESAFAIPSEVIVIRKAQFQISDIESEIKKWILSVCEDCEIQISQLRLQNAKDLDGYDWKLNTTSQPPRGHFTLPLELIKNGKADKKIWLQGHVKVFRTVPVLRRDLSPGMKIQSEDLEFKKRDVTFERNSVPKQDEIFGAEVAQYMSADQVLWKNNLKRKLALQKGAPVSMIIKNQDWTIFAKGISQDNGYVGDLVKVQTLDNKKIVTGTVNIDGTVEVK